MSRPTTAGKHKNIAEWDLLADARAPSPAKTAAAQGAVLTMTGPEMLGAARVNVIRLAEPSGALPFEIEQRYNSTQNRTCCAEWRRVRAESIRKTAATSPSRCRTCEDAHTNQPTFAADAFRFVPPRGPKQQ